LAEIEGLLELIPAASLLVEVRNHRILLANALATELTAYTRSDLDGMAFATLIEKLDESTFWKTPAEPPSSTVLTLRKRNGARVEVRASAWIFLRGKWALLRWRMQVIEQRQAQKRRRQS
jgi:PAS domain-containing protein